jgi:hypothetical protein
MLKGVVSLTIILLIFTSIIPFSSCIETNNTLLLPKDCSVCEKIEEIKAIKDINYESLSEENLKISNQSPKYKNIITSENLPSSFNWMDVNGQNYVSSSHQSQGNCGSCWAFATIRCLESKIKIEKDASGIDIDLSEQDLLSCSGGGNCDGGWPPLQYLKESGVVPEHCFPYKATELPCITKSTNCPNWPSLTTKITDYGFVDYTMETYVEEIKKALIDHGPLIVIVGSPSGNLHATILNGWTDTDENEGYWLTGTYHEPFFPKPFPTGSEYRPRWIEAGFNPDYSLFLEYPVGGEVFEKGDTATISWTASEFVGDVEIRYSTDGGETFPIQVAMMPVEDGCYEWVIPDIDSDDVVIQINGINQDGNYLYIPYDESDCFKIEDNEEPPSLFELLIKLIIEFLNFLFKT